MKQIDLTDTILTAIKNKMASQSLKQKDLAGTLGMSPSYFSRILRREYHLSLDDISKLCTTYGWDPVELLTRPEDYSVEEIMRELDPEHWKEFEHLKDELNQLRDLMLRIEADRVKQQELINRLTTRLLDGGR